MEFKEKTLTCQDCGKEFAFTTEEQKFYQEKGFQEPKRCADCRKQRKQARFSQQEETEIVCSKCGEKGTVPFKPKNPEGLLCEKCFREQNEAK